MDAWCRCYQMLCFSTVLVGVALKEPSSVKYIRHLLPLD